MRPPIVSLKDGVILCEILVAFYNFCRVAAISA